MVVWLAWLGAAGLCIYASCQLGTRKLVSVGVKKVEGTLLTALSWSPPQRLIELGTFQRIQHRKLVVQSRQREVASRLADGRLSTILPGSLRKNLCNTLKTDLHGGRGRHEWSGPSEEVPSVPSMMPRNIWPSFIIPSTLQGNLRDFGYFVLDKLEPTIWP